MVFGTCAASSHESQTSDQKALGPSRATKEAVRQLRPLAFIKEHEFLHILFTDRASYWQLQK
jgi:hypothetical protein